MCLVFRGPPHTFCFIPPFPQFGNRIFNTTIFGIANVPPRKMEKGHQKVMEKLSAPRVRYQAAGMVQVA